jgi:hypothetical protein
MWRGFSMCDPCLSVCVLPTHTPPGGWCCCPSMWSIHPSYVESIIRASSTKGNGYSSSSSSAVAQPQRRILSEVERIQEKYRGGRGLIGRYANPSATSANNKQTNKKKKTKI